MTDPTDIPGLLDLAQEAIIVVRREEGDRPLPEIVLVNRKVSELLGFSRAELIGRTMRALCGRHVSRETFHGFVRAVTHQAVEEFSFPLRTARNHDFRARIRIVPIPTRRDLVSLWILPQVTGDETNDTIEKLRAVLPAVQYLSADYFYILEVRDNLQLKVSWLDERAEAVLGYSLEEFESAGGLAGIVLDEDRQLLRDHHQQLLAGGSTTTQYRIRTPNRSIKRIRDRAQALRRDPTTMTRHIVGALMAMNDHANAATAAPRFRRVGAALASQLHALVCLVSEQGDIVWSSNEPATPLADAIRRANGKDIGRYLAGRQLDDWLDLTDRAFAESTTISATVNWPLEGTRTPIAVNAARIDEELAFLIIRPGGIIEQEKPEGLPSPVQTSTLFAALDQLDVPCIAFNAKGSIEQVNKAARETTGLTIDRLRAGINLRDLFEAYYGPSIEELIEQPTHYPSPTATFLAIRQGDRSRQPRRWLLMSGDSGTGTHVLIAPPSSAPMERQDPWPIIDAILEVTSDGIIIVGDDGKVQAIDTRAAAVLGIDSSTAIGLRPADVFKTARRNDDALELLTDLAADPRRKEVVLAAQRPIATPIELSARFAVQNDTRRLIVALRDARLERENDEALRFFAFYDPLTGLPNRRLFLERLNQAIDSAKAEQQIIGVLLLDLDRFRLINESLGFSTGDQVLSAMAGRLVAQSGDHDTIARLSGDEFMLLSPNIATVEAATRMAQRLLEAVKQPIVVADHELSLSASIGLALFPNDGPTAESLVQNANTACARATENGGNRFQFYADDMNSSALQRLMMETRLRRALNHGELVLYYQPIVRTADGRLLGVEALLRWFHPEMGMVSPADFIPLAEETGLIVPIGNWVLDVACRQILRWQMQFARPDLRLAVNLSARQFDLDDLSRTIAAVLDDTGFPPSCLELELTESVLMRNVEEAERRMEELAALGARLAIDDFGTGYSSLGYLRRFPIHALKIDRSFTKEIEYDPGSAMIVKAIVGLGENLGMRVIAEGVETDAQLRLLRDLRCAEVQGYHLCRPLPAEEVTKALQAGKLPLNTPTG